MKDLKDLAEKINADKEFSMEAYNYIKTELDKENAKPLRRRDFDRIEQLTSQLNELSGGENNKSTEGLYERIKNYERSAAKPVNILKRFAPVLCCLVLVLTVNCVTVLAYNMNIFSAVIEFTKGGFSVNFGKDEPVPVELPTSEDDPYGFIAKLAEYDIEFETPHYIPEGFVLTVVETNVNEKVGNTVRFIFRKDNQNFSIDFSNYIGNVPQIVIPSDHYNISETEVNGSPAIVSKEDNQYTIAYQKGKTVVYMFAQDVPYEECEKIVQSIY